MAVNQVPLAERFDSFRATPTIETRENTMKRKPKADRPESNERGP